jgi:hypothetical protein
MQYLVPVGVLNRQHDDGSGRDLTEAVTQFCRSVKGKLRKMVGVPGENRTCHSQNISLKSYLLSQVAHYIY